MARSFGGGCVVSRILKKLGVVIVPILQDAMADEQKGGTYTIKFILLQAHVDTLYIKQSMFIINMNLSWWLK